MRTKRRVSLGGVQLDSVDSRIIITGVDEAAGKESFSAVSTAGGAGQRVTGERRDTLDIVVKFAIAIKSKDMTARSEVLEKVNTWAAPGGFLRLNYRPGRRLRVILVQAPGAGDQFAWTNEFSLTFRAYGLPYWEDNDAVSATTATGTNKTVKLKVNGSARTVIDATVVNKSGATINNLSLSVLVGSAVQSLFHFTGLNLTANQQLVVDHVSNGRNYYLRIRKGTSASMSSVMMCRQPDSTDDLYAPFGDVTCKVESQRAVAVTFSVRGRYL